MVSTVQHAHAISYILFYVFVPVCRRIVANIARAKLAVGAVICVRTHLWDPDIVERCYEENYNGGGTK